MKTRILGITGVATLGALFTLTPSTALAAGTALDVQGARGTGMASATTAWIDDASAIYYNPAGIAQGQKVMVEAGLNIIAPSFKYTSPSGQDTKTQGVVTPFQLYATAGLTDHVSIGIGVFTPYGLDIKWPDGWAGRSLITKSSLRTYYIDPTMAFKFGPIRFGLGIQIVRATLELQKDINFGDTYGSADLGAGAWATSGNAGFQLEAIKQYLQLGASYRGKAKLDFNNGVAHFSNIPAAFTGTIHDQPVMGSVEQPSSFAMGASSRPIKALNVAVDVVWTQHSLFDSINLHYPDDATHTLDSHQPKNWHDTVNFHVGAEGSLSDNLMIRGGVLIDPSPSRSNTLTPDVPDSSRVNLAVGATYKTDFGVHFDLGYQIVILTGKTSTVPQLPGDYGGFANIIGFTIGYTSKEYGHDKPTEPPAEGAQPAPPGEGEKATEGGAQSAPPDPNLHEPPPTGGARPAPAPEPTAPPPPPMEGGVPPAPPN